MSNMDNLRELCAWMKERQEDIAGREEELKTLKAQLDDVRLRRIPEMMQALEVKTATFEDIGRVQLAADMYCSTVSGRKDDAMQWLRDLGLDDMIKEEYNASSMKALCKRLIADGTEIPDFMNITPFLRASIVKG